jgi:hypothetical protein
MFLIKKATRCETEMKITKKNLLEKGLENFIEVRKRGGKGANV